MIEVMTFISILKEMKDDSEYFEESVAQFEEESNIKIRKKNRKKIVMDGLLDGYNIKNILATIQEAKDYYSDLSRERNSSMRQKQRNIRIYETFMNEFSTVFQRDEIRNFENIVKRIPSQEVRESFLRLVYQHNAIEYQKTDILHKELSKNSSVHFLALLKAYGISKEEVDLGKVMRNDYDDFAIMLAEVSSITKNKSVIIYAIQNSDLEIIRMIKDYKSKGILLESTIISTPYLFLRGSLEYNSLLNNISYFDKYNFNVSNLSNYPDVLIGNESLKSNLDTLEEYDLIRVLKGITNYSFLSNSNLRGVIDKIIELGYEEFLVEDLSLLNEDNWDRLYVLKAMNYRVESKDELLKLLRADTFIVPDCELNNYIPNVVSYYEDESNDGKKVSNIPELALYSSTIRSYNIGGVILSKNRVLRNYNPDNKDKEKALFQAFIKDSILSMEEIEIIEKEIKGTIIKK